MKRIDEWFVRGNGWRVFSVGTELDDERDVVPGTGRELLTRWPTFVLKSDFDLVAQRFSDEARSRMLGAIRLQRLRRRLLRKFLLAKERSYLDDIEWKDRRAEGDDETERLRSWAKWCWLVAKKLEESKR